MAFSEYALLVSLSAGIHAHADIGGISIGPEAITQPNGGVSVATFKVADKHKGITATSAQRIGPTQPSGRDLGTVGGARMSDWNTVPTFKGPAAAIPTSPPNPTVRLPTIRPPRVR